MNIGHIKNEELVNSYKQFGYTTRNQLIDAAVELLKKELLKEQRKKWREAAFAEYAGEKIDNAWESIDGEDFENT